MFLTKIKLFSVTYVNSLSSNKKFLATDNIIQWKDLENDHASSLSLKPSSNLELLVN